MQKPKNQLKVATKVCRISVSSFYKVGTLKYNNANFSSTAASRFHRYLPNQKISYKYSNDDGKLGCVKRKIIRKVMKA